MEQYSNTWFKKLFLKQLHWAYLQLYSLGHWVNKHGDMKMKNSVPVEATERKRKSLRLHLNRKNDSQQIRLLYLLHKQLKKVINLKVRSLMP